MIDDKLDMCDFVFNPELWPRTVHRMDEPHYCPYQSIGNLPYCIFHTVPTLRKRLFPTERQRAAIYQRTVKDAGVLHLTCTIIESLDLAKLSQLVTSDHEIHIGYSTINSMNLLDADIDVPFVIEDCKIEEFDAKYANINSRMEIGRSEINHINLSEARISERSIFQRSEFGLSEFINTVFEKDITFCSKFPDHTLMSEVEGVLGKGACIFRGQALFFGAIFNASAVFAGVDFEKGVSFFHSNFNSGVSFHDLECHIGSHFDFATFIKEGDFTAAALGVSSFKKVEFKGPVKFDGAKFGTGHSYLQEESIADHVIAEGVCQNNHEHISNVLENGIFAHSLESVAPVAASFTDCHSDDLLSLRDINATDHITSFSSYFEHLEVGLKTEEEVKSFAMYGAEIKGGIFSIYHPKTYYEIDSAEIGDLGIMTKGSIGSFDNIYINNTDFNGFNFSSYRDDLRDSNWVIDGVIKDGEHEPSTDRETTYAKAKAGADKIGDTHAESKFFIKERRCRRENHRKRFENSTSKKEQIVAVFNYITNLVFDITAEYAENAGRVIILSTSVVAGFAMLYMLSDLQLSYTASISTPRIFSYQFSITGIEYIIFSMQTFSAFLLGEEPTSANTTVRFLSALQSFIGAFLIGLFVATVVRSVER